MYRHILIPTDGSATAQKAVDAGIDYASKSGAKVLLFTVVPHFRLPRQSEVMAEQHVTSVYEYEEEQGARAGKVLEGAAARAKARNVEFHTAYAFSDRPYEAIIHAAQKHDCDMIFMGSHGRSGIPALWYGSQTREVLTHCDIPTMVYR